MTPPPSRAEQKLETRQQIREAARRRFIEVGYERTTIRDVAQAAGVSVGSVHLHFKDKRALLFACFYAEIAEAVAHAWDTLDVHAPLLDQLLHCARSLYRAYAQHLELSRVMVRESLFAGGDYEPDTNLAPFLEGVAALHRTALERGELTHLPEQGTLAARAFFAAYLAVLIGGLNGHFGTRKKADTTARRWIAQLRPLVQLQLAGLGYQEIQTCHEF